MQVEIYRERVIPLATVVTPNQTEAELLTGVTVGPLTGAARKYYKK